MIRLSIRRPVAVAMAYMCVALLGAFSWQNIPIENLPDARLPRLTPVLGDGGYLLELEKRGWVRAGPFTPEVVLNNPDALRQLHIEFKTAGAEVLQALTFYASRDKLATVGLADKLEEMNRTAVRIANEVAGDHVLVSGNLSLTWMYDPEDAASSDRVRKRPRQARLGSRGRFPWSPGARGSR